MSINDGYYGDPSGIVSSSSYGDLTVVSGTSSIAPGALSTSANSITISNGYGRGSGGSGSLTIGVSSPTYTSGSITPITISSGGYIYANVEKDEIKSKPVASKDEHSHDIQCRLRVEQTKVISEYFCSHCNDVLFSKVISKIPKSIINKKCLSRIVKGV